MSISDACARSWTCLDARRPLPPSRARDTDLRLFDDLSLRDIRSTTTFRLAAILGVLFCLGVVALGALIYGLTTRELTARSDEILHRAASRLLQMPPQGLATEIPQEVSRNVRG